MPQVAVGAVLWGGTALATGVGLSAALAATGFAGFLANFGASLLLSGVAQAAAGKPKAQVDAGLQSRQVTVREPAPARELVYGETRKGGNIIYIATSGLDGFGETTTRTVYDRVQVGETDNGPQYIDVPRQVTEIGSTRGTKLLHLIIVLAGHPVAEIGEVYFEGELAFDAAGNPQGKYAGKAAVMKHFGSGQAFPGYALWLPEWTSAHRLTGCAAIAVRMIFDNETFPNGIPNITARVKGRNDIFDPRTGGRGWSDNAALCLANYMEDARFGLGISIGGDQGIRSADLIEAANICDEAVESFGIWEQRYRCNGVVDTSVAPKDVIEGLLSAMAGKAIRKGGQWSIHAGAYRAPTLHLTDDDAAGNLQLTTRMSRAENFNGVRGKFISPTNDWQLDDFPAYKSGVYIAEDSGKEVWRDITLPFTTSPYAAQRIAKIELETARRQMSVTFPARLRTIQAACGDTVSLTRDRWGFSQKPFAITGMTLQPVADGIGLMPVLSLSEISPLAWSWAATEGQIYAAAPRSTLPPAWFIAAPGITDVREELYVTRTGDGAAARSIITWSESADPRVDRYVLQWSSDGSNWAHVAETIATTASHEGWSAGSMHYRVQAIGRMGQRSSWTTWQGQLYGLAAPPAALTGVSIQTAGGLAVIKWSLPSDLDVRYGGRIAIRHAAGVGAAWSNTLSLDEVHGNTTIAVVPLMPGAYFVRAVDASGQMGPVSVLYADGAQALEFVDAGLLQADDEFSGHHDGTIRDGSVLTLTDIGLFDDVPDTDALLSWDYPYGVASRGVYTFATTLAWSAPRLVRLRSIIEMAPNVLNDDWDQRTGEVDSWLSWDAMADIECDVEMQVRTTNDNPASSPVWSDWSRLDAGEYRARAVQARAILTSTSPDVAPVVSVLRVKAEQAA